MSGASSGNIPGTLYACQTGYSSNREAGAGDEYGGDGGGPDGFGGATGPLTPLTVTRGCRHGCRSRGSLAGEVNELRRDEPNSRRRRVGTGYRKDTFGTGKTRQ